VQRADKDDDKQWSKIATRGLFRRRSDRLPQYLRRTRADFSSAAWISRGRRGARAFWRKELGGGPALRVGIAWRGGTPRSRQFARSTALPQWLPLLRLQGAVFW